REIAIRYDVEETARGPRGVVRLSLPEKIARSLAEEELPRLDRPMRFVVARGARGAARGESLDALRDELDRPFTDNEIAELDRAAKRRRAGTEERRRGPRTPYGLPPTATPARNPRRMRRDRNRDCG